MFLVTPSRTARAGILLAFILGALPVLAQLQIDGLHLNANGDVAFGYDGQYGDLTSSSHDYGIGGNGNVNGYYYNPNFLSFQANPYYDRGQGNAETTSISDSRGYTLSSVIFGGSKDPGYVSFSQGWDQDSLYGLPGLPGLITTGDSRNFGAGWTFRDLPFIPYMGLSYSDSQTDTSLLGSGLSTSSNTKGFGASIGGYNLAGFPLGLTYQHMHNTSESNLYSSDGASDISENTTNTFLFATGHSLPHHSVFRVSAFRAYMDSNSPGAGESSHSVDDDISASITSHVWRLPLSGSVDYNDNVYGEILQELNSSGQMVPITTNEPTVRSLLMNVSTSYSFPHSIFATVFGSRQEEWILGTSFSATQFGATVNYHFGRRFKGLTFTVGANDGASQAGNYGAALISNVTYLRNFGNWETSSSVSYSQNVQTMLAMYTQSQLSYTASVRRHLQNGLSLNIGGGGGRSVFVQQAGNSSHSETVNASVNWLRQTANTSYSQSSGTAIATSQGLVLVTTPGLVPNLQQVFSGQSFVVGYGNSLIRHLAFNSGWSKFTSNGSGQGVFSHSSSTEFIASLQYTYRKLSYYSRVVKYSQGLNSQGIPPSTGINYSFGVSRWFNFF